MPSMPQTIVHGLKFLVILSRVLMKNAFGLQMRVGFRQVVLFVNRSLAEQGNLFNISNEMATVKISLSL